jgi:hypothetical protein
MTYCVSRIIVECRFCTTMDVIKGKRPRSVFEEENVARMDIAFQVREGKIINYS